MFSCTRSHMCTETEGAGAWVINVPCGLWAGEHVCYKNRLGSTLKGARDTEISTALVKFSLLRSAWPS